MKVEFEKKQFDFTVIMAVYNAEPFLKEAVLSLLSQDIGFEEHVQLILVDDGSTDGSGEICDRFAACFPENILAIHQENAGVSAARNAGIPHIQGKYVNFMDADDKLSRNTLSKVKAFFQKHGDKVDLVSIPMEFFDARTGQHILNYKYKKGTRVIDLTKEYDAIQLSLSSGFTKAECLKDNAFDVRLTNMEDAKVCTEILKKKKNLGVVSDAQYMYRRRSMGAPSAVQNNQKNPSWYLPSLKYFSSEVLACDEEENPPLFVQYLVMYDLQWHLISKETIKRVLSEEEFIEYCNLFFSLLKKIDNKIIMAQKNISRIREIRYT